MSKPMYGGRVYTCWTKGGLQYEDVRMPITCGKWDCMQCGDRKFRRLVRDIVTAWKAEYGDAMAVMMTLTWRAPEWENGFRKWNQHSRRFKKLVGLKQWEIDVISEKRRQMTLKEQDAEMTRQLQKLSIAWKKKWGVRPDWFRVSETTKQGTLHCHMVMPWKPWIMKGPVFLNWMRETWSKITKDSHRVHIGDPERHQELTGYEYTLVGTLCYPLKYICKGLISKLVGEYPHRRRYNCTKGFPRCWIRSAEFARSAAGGFMDQWGWRRTTGKKYKAQQELMKWEERMWKYPTMKSVRAAYSKALKLWLDRVKEWNSEKERRDDLKLRKVTYDPKFEPDDLNIPREWYNIQYVAQLRDGTWIRSAK